MAMDPYTSRLFQLESGGDPNAVTGSNRGLGQFGPSEEAQFGLSEILTGPIPTRAGRGGGAASDGSLRRMQPRTSHVSHQKPDERPFDSERKANYVLFSFYSTGESRMFRTIAEEAAALASLALFLGMIAIWAQVIATL